MPMTWGDALAAVLGRTYGRHQYTLLGTTRSLEGSLVMFGASALSTWLALTLLGADGATGLALVIAAGASVAEAISPWGLDNLVVPATSALMLALLAP